MKSCAFFLRNNLEIVLILAGILLLIPSFSDADTVTWSWFESTGNWNVAGYWSTGWIPMPGDDVVVSSTEQVSANTTDIVISSLTLTPDVGDAPLVILNSGAVEIVPPWIYDSWSGIYWGHPLVYTLKTYDQASNWAQARGKRLPTFQEMMNFMTQSNFDTTGCITNGVCYAAGGQYNYKPELEADGFVIKGAERFWTTTPDTKFVNSNWSFWIATGYASNQLVTDTLNVWMVRDVLP